MIDQRVHIGRQIGVIDLKAVIDDAYRNAVSAVSVPYRCHVRIDPRKAAVLAGIVEVPLVGSVLVAPGEPRIVWYMSACLLSSEKWFRRGDTGQSFHVFEFCRGNHPDG